MRKWKSEEWQTKLIFAGMILILLAVLIPLFAIAHYNFSSVDDFEYAKAAGKVWEETGSVFSVLAAQVEYTWNYYNNWQGTFFNEWLTTSLMGIFAKNAYYMSTYLTLGAFVIAGLVAFGVILIKGLGADKYRAGIIAMCCVCMQVLLTPVPVEAFYWFCGSMLYTFIHAMAWLLVAFLVLFYFDKGKSKVKTTLLEIVILLFTIAIAGSNYVTALTVLLMYVFYMIWMFYQKHPYRILIVCNVVVYLAAFLVNVMAPGNRNRQTSSGVQQMSAVESILLSLQEALEYICINFIPPCVILGILFIPLFWNIVQKRNYRYSWPMLVTILSFGVFAAQFTPTLYALHITGAGRIQNLYRFNYYVWLYGNELYWIGWLWRKWRERYGEESQNTTTQQSKVSYLLPGWMVGGVLLCISLYLWGGNTVTTMSAIRDLRTGVAQQYYAENQERLKLFEDENIKEVYVAPFSVKPYLLFFGDIQEDTNDWVNYTLAVYFGKDKVGLLPKEQ